MSYNESGLRRAITAGLLLAITLLLVFARLGMIPVPTPAGNATIAHIPAIIAGILEGPLAGLIVGMGFGFASLTSATIPMFKDPLVALVPRLLIGITAAWAYYPLRRASKRVLGIMVAVLYILLLVFCREVYLSTPWAGIALAVVSTAGVAYLYWWMRREEAGIIGLAIAGAVGSLTNTVLVLTAAVWRGYIPGDAAWGIGLTHGIPEVIVSAIIVVAVVAALRQIGRRKGGSSL